MKECIECNRYCDILEYETYNDDGEKKIINVCSKCLDYFNYYNDDGEKKIINVCSNCLDYFNYYKDTHSINCDVCGSLLEVDPYHYFKDNTTIYYCYNCEVWTY